MDDATQDLAIAIGARLKHERLARGWTLDHLAATSGLSRRMVINVEQGTANPSVGTLLRLSDALGVGLPALVEPPAANGIERARVTRAGEGAMLWSGSQGGRGVLVGGTQPPAVLELWDWTLAPRERHESESHAPGTHEILHVLDGGITLELDGSLHVLDTGDAITFASDCEHAYANPHDRAARFSLAVFEPEVGA
ncbi:helix-turn-helix transcriptional regulator [Micrococcales bacterium 31B]|nr:helix-turn-helix transcriptional regulator [Micrococcales bacterium 31B]